MKVRPQVARPCEKKGIDNHHYTDFCECVADCKKLDNFLHPDSQGTINYNRGDVSLFSGCLPLEVALIQDQLLRYESRENGGLEILFEGIEGIQNLNAEIYNYEGLDGPDMIEVGLLDPVGNFLTDKLDNDKFLTKGRFNDKGLRDYFPEALGFTQSSIHSLWADRPRNLQDSFFKKFYLEGLFENQSDDIRELSVCLYHGVDTPKEMKLLWPRYTEKRYLENKSKIWTFVHKKIPSWAKRFNKIWDKLSVAQAEALKLEWFYDEDEKPSQEENAKKLNLSVSSYQERLEWAYKKLEKLYPEFERRRRRTKSRPKREQPMPLYEILSNGERVQIEFPTMQEKKLSSKERRKIKEWAKWDTTNLILDNSAFEDDDDDNDKEEEDENLSARPGYYALNHLKESSQVILTENS